MTEKETIDTILCPTEMTEEEKFYQENYGNELWKIADVSGLANYMMRKMVEYRVEDIKDAYCRNDCWFHPNGPSGCVIMNDDSIFGIRCDHLIFVEGWTEGGNNKSILIIGNHKGTLVEKLILFDEEYEFATF